jgi:chromosomal replication initiator protein
MHGPSGVGKSRLLAGLVVEWLRRHPAAAIAHLDAAAFAGACLDAAGQADGNGWAELRARFRAVDLLVLEDLEGLERAPLAREELIHTLDTLEDRGAGVVLSARTSPCQWPRPAWPARLVNRLLGGLAVRIDPPSLASRRRYILECARALDLALSAEAVESLAETADGYRTLDGWLARLALEARADQDQGTGSGPRGPRAPANAPTRPSGSGPGRPGAGAVAVALDLSTVTALLGEETELAASRLTIEQIARAVAARFGVRLSSLRGPGRQASVVEARHLAMHLARLHTGLSFATIGAYFGRRDPATVRHACKAAAERISVDPALAAAISHCGRTGD